MANIGGFKYPTVVDDPNVATDIKNLADSINLKQARVVSNVAALSTLTGMVPGDTVYVVSVSQAATYDGTALAWMVRDTDWYVPTLSSPWQPTTNLGFASTPAYTRRNEQVFIKGIAGGGTVGAIIFNLPFGFRPQKIKSFLGHVNGSGGEILIKPNGDIVMAQIPASTTLTSCSLECNFLLF